MPAHDFDGPRSPSQWMPVKFRGGRRSDDPGGFGERRFDRLHAGSPTDPSQFRGREGRGHRSRDILCKFYNQPGGCQSGRHCKFVHATSVVQGLGLSPRSGAHEGFGYEHKSLPHGMGERSGSSPYLPRTVCKFHLKGYCREGRKCPYLHVSPGDRDFQPRRRPGHIHRSHLNRHLFNQSQRQHALAALRAAQAEEGDMAADAAAAAAVGVFSALGLEDDGVGGRYEGDERGMRSGYQRLLGEGDMMPFDGDDDEDYAPGMGVPMGSPSMMGQPKDDVMLMMLPAHFNGDDWLLDDNASSDDGPDGSNKAGRDGDRRPSHPIRGRSHMRKSSSASAGLSGLAAIASELEAASGLQTRSASVACMLNFAGADGGRNAADPSDLDESVIRKLAMFAMEATSPSGDSKPLFARRASAGNLSSLSTGSPFPQSPPAPDTAADGPAAPSLFNPSPLQQQAMVDNNADGAARTGMAPAQNQMFTSLLPGSDYMRAFESPSSPGAARGLFPSLGSLASSAASLDRLAFTRPDDAYHTNTAHTTTSIDGGGRALHNDSMTSSPALHPADNDYGHFSGAFAGSPALRPTDPSDGWYLGQSPASLNGGASSFLDNHLLSPRNRTSSTPSLLGAATGRRTSAQDHVDYRSQYYAGGAASASSATQLAGTYGSGSSGKPSWSTGGVPATDGYENDEGYFYGGIGTFTSDGRDERMSPAHGGSSYVPRSNSHHSMRWAEVVGGGGGRYPSDRDSRRHHYDSYGMGGSSRGDRGGGSGRICKFFLQGNCIHGARCRNSHDVPLPDLDRGADPPRTPEEIARLDEEEIMRSRDAECVICHEPITGRFGLLSHCDHTFCCQCIRHWRQQNMEGQETSNVRSCPVCKTLSHFVVPHVRHVTDPIRKGNLITTYKGAMAKRPCKYYQDGEECPFGASCFYAHLKSDGTPASPPRLRTRMGAEGTVEVVQDVKLSHFFDLKR